MLRPFDISFGHSLAKRMEIETIDTIFRFPWIRPPALETPEDTQERLSWTLLNDRCIRSKYLSRWASRRLARTMTILCDNTTTLIHADRNAHIRGGAVNRKRKPRLDSSVRWVFLSSSIVETNPRFRKFIKNHLFLETESRDRHESTMQRNSLTWSCQPNGIIVDTEETEWYGTSRYDSSRRACARVTHKVPKREGEIKNRISVDHRDLAWLGSANEFYVTACMQRWVNIINFRL